MKMISFLLFNLLILFAHYLFLTRLKTSGLSHKFVVIGVLFTAQIILTELILAVFGWLYLSILIFVNLIISGALFIFSIQKFENIKSDVLSDLKSLRSHLSVLSGLENTIVIILILFASLWIALAVYFLPPRGVDDLTYHLAPIYEAIQRHKFIVLPMELRTNFAFPFNAELLFLWPAIFFHSQQYVDCVQLFVGLWGIVVVYALARLISIPARIAFFIAGLFFLSPVVLAQAGSNYIDLIVNVFYLTALYFFIRFAQTQSLENLYWGGLTCGIVAGMKYHMLIPLLTIQPFIFYHIRRISFKHLLGYIGIILMAGGYWYFRNAFTWGSPFFPITSHDTAIPFMDYQGSAQTLQGKIIEKFLKLFLLFYDIGRGSYHGGYGTIFWVIALPLVIYYWMTSIIKIRNNGGWIESLLWAQVPIGIFLLFLVPIADFGLSPRFSLYVIAIGFLALGKFFYCEESKKLAIRTFQILCLFSAIISINFLSTMNLPSYAIQFPLKDIQNKTYTTETKYLKLSGSMAFVWKALEALDFLTINRSNGLNSYLAISGELYWTSPIYGTNLQNKIWNFQSNPSSKPDALIYCFSRFGDIGYLGKIISVRDVLRDTDYQLVIGQMNTFLFIKKSFFDDTQKQRLADFYKISYPEMIQKARSLKPQIKSQSLIVTSAPLGYGLKYLELTKEISNPVYLVPKGKEQEIMKSYRRPDVVSFY